jgi:hypothetical protein
VTITYEVMSLAFCLHEEPLPGECGCCPSLADSLTVKQATEPLPLGATRVQVQCEPGQSLVIGNCTIDLPSTADLAEVTMFRFGSRLRPSIPTAIIRPEAAPGTTRPTTRRKRSPLRCLPGE